jgi:hypothetical protein
MGVYMTPLADLSNDILYYSNDNKELKLTGREEDLIKLMKKHPNFTIHDNKENHDDIFVSVKWGCDLCGDRLHIETLKEEFPEWSHDFFEQWEGHSHFHIR